MARPVVRLKQRPIAPSDHDSHEESGTNLLRGQRAREEYETYDALDLQAADDAWAQEQADLDALDSLPTVALRGSGSYERDLCGEDAPTARRSSTFSIEIAVPSVEHLQTVRPHASEELVVSRDGAIGNAYERSGDYPIAARSLAPMAMDAYRSTPPEGMPLPDRIRAPWDFDTFRVRFDAREILARRVVMFTAGFAIAGALMLIVAALSFLLKQGSGDTSFASQPPAAETLPSAVNLGVPPRTVPPFVTLPPPVETDEPMIAAPTEAPRVAQMPTTITPVASAQRHAIVVAPPRAPSTFAPPVSATATATAENKKALEDAKRETEGSLN